MTGAPIDNAITNTVLPQQSQGAGVPDSIPTLAASPQLVMPPGVVKPVFRFEDGEGLTDAFGNVYEGYLSQGGVSAVVVNHDSQNQFSSTAPNDKEFWQFSTAQNLWVKVSHLVGRLMEFDGVSAAPLDGEVAIYDATNSVWIPQKSDEPFTGIIEVPTNRVYDLAKDGLAYDVEVVAWSFLFETGPGSVTFPAVSSVISAGTPIQITVTATTGTSVFLNFQLDVKRRLAP